MNRFLASALAVACVLCGALGSAQVPKLSSAIPTGIVPGQAVDVALIGEALAHPTGLWTNLPGSVTLAPGIEQNGDMAGRVTYRVELPADAALGVYALRLATERGISNVRLLVVDDLPTVLDSSDNVSLAKAQQLYLPTAVEGAVKAENRQYYKFHAAAGQRLSVEVLAQRFGSPLDSLVRLLDERGQELAYSDDDEATGSDSRFVHRFTAEGEYYLEIGDVRFYGSADYRYRLRIGDFPLVTAPFPLGVQSGSVGRIEVTGTAVDDLPTLEARAPANLGAREAEGLRLKVAYPGGQGSGVAMLLAGRSQEQVEFEPNDRLETASPVDAVGAVNGRFAEDHDRDYFRFAAKKGARLRMVGRTRSLGITRDLLLRLFDPQGKPVAEGTPTRTDDSQIDFLFPDDGIYTLLVEDLAGHGGPDHVYRIEFAPAVAGFSLMADADRYNVPRGGVFRIVVAVGAQRLLGTDRPGAHHARRGSSAGRHGDPTRQIRGRLDRDSPRFADARHLANVPGGGAGHDRNATVPGAGQQPGCIAGRPEWHEQSAGRTGRNFDAGDRARLSGVHQTRGRRQNRGGSAIGGQSHRQGESHSHGELRRPDFIGGRGAAGRFCPGGARRRGHQAGRKRGSSGGDCSVGCGPRGLSSAHCGNRDAFAPAGPRGRST